MVTVEITRWPTRHAQPGGPRHRGARRHRRARRRHQDHHPQVQHSRSRTARKSIAEAHASRRRRGASTTCAAAPTSAPSRPSRSTASTRAISTMRSRSRRCRTATTGSACTSPTSSHYVREGSALDGEALRTRARRSTFPSAPSTCSRPSWRPGLCSLNPHVDRLVQSCLMEVDARGQVVRYELHDGVINSDARMTYTDGQRDPDRPAIPRRSRTLPRARADVRADARAVPDPERPPPPPRLDRLRPAGGRGRAGRGRADRGDRRDASATSRTA